MNRPHDFLSCDWGSTSFRLRWVQGPEHNVFREIREASGVKVLYEEANQNGARDEKSRAPFFAKFLNAKLEALLGGTSPPATPLPVFISGMVSSSVGWRELPYAKAPFALDGSNTQIAEIEWTKPQWIGATYLISGVATEHEMMRGEETEIIGLMAEPSFEEYRNCSTVILPGTHSKHIRIEDGHIVDWRTFMTGELFEVLGTHSLLRASVEMNSKFDSAAFIEGVRWANERGLSEALFRVRTRAVLGKLPPTENTSFLSGILIGAELAGLNTQTSHRPVILAATGRFAELYQLALKTIAHPEGRWISVSPELPERAVVSAHALLLQRLAI
jgi:2-dehydro-3-deoxygalactonokinase